MNTALLRLIYASTSATAQFAKAFFLTEFDALINTGFFENGLEIYGHMAFSCLRGSIGFGFQCQDIRQCFAILVDKDTPVLEHVDPLAETYWTHRTIGIPHAIAFELAVLRWETLLEDGEQLQ